MIDYKYLIILSYFYQNNSGEYSFSRIQNYVGLTFRQLEDILFHLIDDKFLEYKENLLFITSKGVIKVLSNNMDSFPFELDIEYESINEASISKDDKLDIEDIYIPKRFNEKINSK